MIDFFKPKYKCDVPIIILFVLLIIMVLLCSCSANWHIARAIKKDPSILKKDTITIHDTTIIPTVSHDTTIISKPIDTITIEKERLRIKITRHYDTLRIEGECIGDTIFKEIRVQTEKVVYKPKVWYERWWWLILIVIGILIYVKK